MNDLNIDRLEIGKFGTLKYRLYHLQNNKKISIWNDIPMRKSEQYFYYVNEIPKGMREKIEMLNHEKYHPLGQDKLKNGKPRYFKYGPIPFNYGFIPQTWECPNELDVYTGLVGDNDPIDFVEIGKKMIPCGEIVVVKIVGIIALIDQGETDWKVIGIDINNPISAELNSLEDVEKYFPHKLNDIKEWFIKYKTAVGKPENKIALNGKIMDADEAVKIIEKTHQYWNILTKTNN